jgi:hypothetical protein
MTNTVNFESINNEIVALINNENFRKTCAETAEKIGITAQEWNANKVNILYMWASQVVCNK